MRAAVVALAFFFVDCHGSRASTPNLTPEPTPLSIRTIDAGKVIAVKDSGSCASIYAERARADAGAFTGPGENCMVTKSGAWGLVLDGPPMRANMPRPSTSEMHSVHASGASIVSGPRESWSSITKLGVFDFDGDGEEELVVEGTRGCLVNMDLTCQGDLPEVEILTWKSGRIEPYPSPAPIGLAPAFDESDTTLRYRAVRDADGDGRPDLETYAFYEASTTDMDVTTFFLHGPTFLAHSLPDGKFSLNDDVAKKALAESCAAAVPFAKAKPTDLYTTAICARLSGEATGTIAARYATRCIALLAPVQAFWTAMAHGRPPPPGDIDFTAAGTCRTEPERATSMSRGIPRSLVKMLERTVPLLDAAKRP